MVQQMGHLLVSLLADLLVLRSAMMLAETMGLQWALPKALDSGAASDWPWELRLDKPMERVTVKRMGIEWEWHWELQRVTTSANGSAQELVKTLARCLVALKGSVSEVG
mmetsp:Transcript_28069/g.73607  ORF Transcript_28069/g.73607 Transcript_28069/m.73607 type:complete len:109 (-) Transcript_28069:563-889(-)